MTAATECYLKAGYYIALRPFSSTLGNGMGGAEVGTEYMAQGNFEISPPGIQTLLPLILPPLLLKQTASLVCFPRGKHKNAFHSLIVGSLVKKEDLFKVDFHM